MGKLVTVKTGYSAVLLPDKAGSGGLRNYNPGDTVTVTDAEYSAFNAATLAAITLTTSGLDDPYRASTYAQAGKYQTVTFAGTTGGTIGLGTTRVQAPATGVTYQTSWLTVPANNPATAVVGPTPGAAFVVRLVHKQGATSASTAPTAKNWFVGATTLWPGGTVPTFTAATNAIDLFEFITFDGGATYYNYLTVKGLA